VTDESLRDDQTTKARVYARARLPIYWIVNLPESKVEVYSQPRAGKNPAYRKRQEYDREASVPLVIAECQAVQVPVSELLPA
jgi:Uma2 family endonuclease